MRPEAQVLDQAIAGMNEAQRQAVLWDEGAMLVLAGPGSGKTRVLTCRIARLLQDSPEQSYRVLAVTFTNKAADEMRQRLEHLAPEHGHRLFLGTFHSFCSEVLRTHGMHVGVKPDFQIYSARQDLLTLVAGVLSDRQTPPLKGGWRLDPEGILSTLDRLRGDLVSPEEVGQHFPDPRMAHNVAVLYRGFEARLRALNAMDFGSLLLCAHELFRKYPAVSRHYRKLYRFWCVDEFQDTNGAQYRLLKQMADDSFRNLFVVADDDQIIYAWNGASHQRLVDFRREFQPQVVQLATNYRCPAPILALANRLIAHNYNRTPGKEPLQPGRVCEPGPERIRLQRCASDQEEARWIAADIEQREIGSEATAVLARNRALLTSVAQALQARGIRAALAQRRDEFSSPQFQWLHACLRQEVYRTDVRNLAALVGSFGLMTGLDAAVEEVQNRAGATDGDLLRAWLEVMRESQAEEALLGPLQRNLLDGRDYRRFVKEFLAWLGAQPRVEEAFSDLDEDRRAWQELWAEISRAVGPTAPLSSFLQELELRSKSPAPSSDAVRLLTIHSAKGLEWPHVYVAGLAEEVLPSYQSVKAGAQSLQMEEERRNCFVAITRARETLTMCFAETYRGWRKRPSRFLCEMGLVE